MVRRWFPKKYEKKKKLLKNDEFNHLTNIILDLQPEMKLKYMFISTHGGGIFLV